MKTTIHVNQISSDEAKTKAFAIRMRVFVREQGVPPDIELDPDDRRAIHFLASIDGKAVGTARIVARRASVKIGRMAVLKGFRGKGVGARLLTHALAAAHKLGARKIYLHAQVAVLGFYEKAGFVCVGLVFDEAGIPHRKMVWKKAIGIKQQRTAKKKRARGGLSTKIRFRAPGCQS